jgi:hypothetical protein
MSFGFVTGGHMANFTALAAMRISVCNWSTTGADVERSIEAIREPLRNMPDRLVTNTTVPGEIHLPCSQI